MLILFYTSHSRRVVQGMGAGTSLGRRGHTAIRRDAENALVARMACKMVDGPNWHDSNH